MVNDRRLDLYLDGTLAGRLAQSSSGDLSFVYDDAYRALPDATPLSLAMPLATARHRKRVVLPWLQGLLPDNADALRAIARRFQVSANNPFALLEYVGRDVAGAVQVVPLGEPAPDAGRRGVVRAVSDDQVSRMLSQVVGEYTEGASYADDLGRFSLAGAQPKVALHRLGNGGWGVPEDATPTTHILKPVAGALRGVDVVEQMTMAAAAYLGNDVARTEVAVIGDWQVLISERYDRRQVRGVWHRLHQEDFCQALSVPPDKKYQQQDGGPGIARISELIRSLPFAADRAAVGAAFYKAFVFNVVAGCTDAHAKNYSLMLEGRSVRLAPLYDLLTYAGYWDGTSRINSVMSVAGDYALDRISVRQLVEAGRRFGVPTPEAEGVVDSVRRGVVDAFATARESLVRDVPAAAPVADGIVEGIRDLPLVAG